MRIKQDELHDARVVGGVLGKCFDEDGPWHLAAGSVNGLMIDDGAVIEACARRVDEGL